MSKEKLDILVLRKLKGRRINPSEEAWEKITSQIHAEKSRSLRLKLQIASAAAIAILFISGSFFIYVSDDNNLASVNINTIQENEIKVTGSEFPTTIQKKAETPVTAEKNSKQPIDQISAKPLTQKTKPKPGSGLTEKLLPEEETVPHNTYNNDEDNVFINERQTHDHEATRPVVKKKPVTVNVYLTREISPTAELPKEITKPESSTKKKFFGTIREKIRSFVAKKPEIDIQQLADGMDNKLDQFFKDIPLALNLKKKN